MKSEKRRKSLTAKALRRLIAGLGAAVLIAGVIIDEVMPYETRRYWRQNEFVAVSNRDNVLTAFAVVFYAGAAVLLCALIKDLRSNSGLLEKVRRVLLNAVVLFGFALVMGVGAVIVEPYGAYDGFGEQEFSVGGHKVVMNFEYDSLHNCRLSLWEIKGERAYFLGGREFAADSLEDTEFYFTAERLTLKYNAVSGAIKEKCSLTVNLHGKRDILCIT